MGLKAGTIADFDGSMAEAILNAMRQEWQNEMGTGQPFTSNKQLQLLCVAVAQGVIGYLAENANDSISVDITDDHGIFPVDISTQGTLY